MAVKPCRPTIIKSEYNFIKEKTANVHVHTCTCVTCTCDTCTCTCDTCTCTCINSVHVNKPIA